MAEGAGPNTEITIPRAVTVAWFHCFSGIAGDMAMGALVDAGADLDEVRDLCERLPVGGWALEAESVLRTGIGGTKVHVLAEPSTVVRTAAHITGLVEEARLPERVRRRALATFTLLAEVEGHLHRRPPEQVHFHEVGGIDAIIDVVGTCAALEVLGVDEVCASPVANGIGMVRNAHGLMPNPVPAVVELLRGAPTYSLDIAMELTTPTGAALLAAIGVGWGPLPAMRIERSGFGAGTAELGDRPNLTQVVIGERTEVLDDGQPVTLLEVNVDDATGEQLAHAVAELLEAGAHDAWLTPILMKKGRPAHTVSVLVDPSLAAQVAAVLTRETGSFGVRGQALTRWPQSRLTEQVDVDGYPLRIKVGAGRAKVEHDDAVRVARRTGRSRREIVAEAEDAWRRRGQEAPTEVASIHGHGHAHPDRSGDGTEHTGTVVSGWPDPGDDDTASGTNQAENPKMGRRLPAHLWQNLRSDSRRVAATLLRSLDLRPDHEVVVDEGEPAAHAAQDDDDERRLLGRPGRLEGSIAVLLHVHVAVDRRGDLDDPEDR